MHKNTSSSEVKRNRNSLLAIGSILFLHSMLQPLHEQRGEVLHDVLGILLFPGQVLKLLWGYLLDGFHLTLVIILLIPLGEVNHGLKKL